MVKKAKEFLCWVCKNHHILMICKSLYECSNKSVPCLHKLCWNCFSKRHQINDWKSEMKDEHISLHIPNKFTPPHTNSSAAFT